MGMTETELQPLVEIRGLSKSFGPVQALKSVDFTLRPGEVHALLGENGAGKSTLIKILAGVQQADGGSMEVLGTPWSARSTAESRDAGISVVYQELSLIPGMSVAANLTLGRETLTASVIRRRRDVRAIQKFIDDLGVDLDARARVESLPFAYRQMTEILKALLGDVKVLVLDEPTSALSAGEEDVLFDAVRRVTAAGVGVIYVTHRMDEVFRLSQRVTVLRDGASVATFDTGSTTMRDLVATIVGPGKSEVRDELEREAASAAGAAAPEAEAFSSDAPVRIELRGVSNERLNHADISVRAGEIRGIAGQVGSGRTELLETIFGARHAREGTVLLDGVPVRFRRTDQAIRAGIAMVPEDRHIEGLVVEHPLDWNISMPFVGTTSGILPLNRRHIRALAENAISRFSIKARSVHALASQLSGGNQQKIVFGRWADPAPKVLLLDEPTAGVDVGAREEIYKLIREFARQGTTVIVVSSDLVELLLISERISIAHDGTIVQTIDRSQIENTEDLHLLVQNQPAFDKEQA